MLNDPKVNLERVAETPKMSNGSLFNIVHVILGMRELFARWLPRLLTVDKKRIIFTTSKQNLALFTQNPTEFWDQFITIDISLYSRVHITVQTRVSPNESAPKRPETQQWARKDMGSIFWNALSLKRLIHNWHILFIIIGSIEN